LNAEHAAGLAAVVALHAAVLYGLTQSRPVPLPGKAETLFVTLVQPAAPPKPAPPKPAPPPRPARPDKPRTVDLSRQLAVEASATPNDFTAPPPPAPAIEAPSVPPAPPPRPAGPVELAGELALACPSRPPPAYPALSRRLGESGKVMLRVEIAADGRIDSARVISGSGYRRLDEAARSAVAGWRCNPPLRDGRPVRAVALQPFQFNLE